eukprot:Blabericola_migrator_1__12487@NODE_78_length_15130_cov_126_174401_g70_i0_p1_GENE_NODE_78_length_15130_cov_126_174401_g70_i0NODE_78_length_15130_cov_126_174401_g70_i0_p1_ORF_typecomplete_len971_score170_51Nup188_C/PF18378_1/0_018_NODE_78_length_15130_cov_126_174401_g70_i01038913301
MDLKEAADIVFSIKQCFCHEDDLHKFKLKSAIVQFDDVTTELSLTASAMDACLGYLDEWQQRYLNAEDEEGRLLASRVFCSLLRLCDIETVAQGLATDYNLVELLSSRLAPVDPKPVEAGSEDFGRCHQITLMGWLSILLLSPMPLEDAVVEHVESFALKFADLGSQLMSVSAAVLSAIVIRSVSKGNRVPLLEMYRARLSSLSYFSLMSSLTRNLKLLQPSELQDLTNMTLKLISEDLPQAAENTVALETLHNLLKDVILVSEAVKQVIGLSLNLLGCDKFASQCKAASILATVLSKYPEYRHQTLEAMFQVWDLDPLGRFSLGLMFFAAEVVSHQDTDISKEEGTRYLRVCAEFFQGSLVSRDRQLTLDVCCYFVWKLAKSQVRWVMERDNRPLLEALLRQSILAYDKSGTRASIAVIQEIIGRGLVGDGGLAMDLIPSFERDGISSPELVLDLVASHSDFGYQACVASIVDCCVDHPRHGRIDSHLRSLHKILKARPLPVTAAERLIAKVEIELKSANYMVPLLKLLSVVLTSDPCLHVPLQVINDLMNQCKSECKAVSGCKDDELLSKATALSILVIQRDPSQTSFDLVASLIRLLHKHACCRVSALTHELVFFIDYLGHHEEAVKLATMIRLLAPLPPALTKANMCRLTFNMLIARQLKQVILHDTDIWVSMFLQLVAAPSAVSSVVLCLEFLSLWLPAQLMYRLCQFVLGHSQIAVRQTSHVIASLIELKGESYNTHLTPLHIYTRHIYRYSPWWESEALTYEVLFQGLLLNPRRRLGDPSAHFDLLTSWTEPDFLNQEWDEQGQIFVIELPPCLSTHTFLSSASVSTLRFLSLLSNLGVVDNPRRAHDVKTLIYKKLTALEGVKVLIEMESAVTQVAAEYLKCESCEVKDRLRTVDSFDEAKLPWWITGVDKFLQIMELYHKSHHTDPDKSLSRIMAAQYPIQGQRILLSLINRAQIAKLSKM